jgi:hypothetical protein
MPETVSFLSNSHGMKQKETQETRKNLVFTLQEELFPRSFALQLLKK